jgi:hypothetical protein
MKFSDTRETYKPVCKSTLLRMVALLTNYSEINLLLSETKNSFFKLKKLILKLVISFMNRKSSCGYATHFFFNFNFLAIVHV